MGPARDTLGKKAKGGCSLAAGLACGTCVALLLGIPPVLGLPSAVAASGRALAFSSLRTFGALGLLAGAAASGRLPVRARPGLFWVGVCSVCAYAALTAAALLGARGVTQNQAIYLGLVSYGLVSLGSFSCGAAATLPEVAGGACDVGGAVSRGPSPAPAGRAAAVGPLPVAALAGFALLSLGILAFSVGAEPNWTLARRAYASVGSIDTVDLCQVLVYVFSGIVGPGTHVLQMGAAHADARLLAVMLAWLFVCVLAACADERVAGAGNVAGAGRRRGLPGLALGVIAARCLAELVPMTPSGYRVAGCLAVIGGLALLLGRAALARRTSSAVVEPADPLTSPSRDLSSLSPREREAVEGRLAKKTSAEVALQMGVSPSTVRNLQARAAKKLGVASLDELCEKGAPMPEPAPEHKEAPKSRALIAVAAAVAACALCAAASAIGEWTSVMLAGEAVLALSLAACCFLNTRPSGQCFIAGAPLCGVGFLLGGCAGIVAAAPGSSLAAGAAAALAAALLVLGVSVRAVSGAVLDLRAKKVAVASALCICAFVAAACGVSAALFCSGLALLMYLASEKGAAPAPSVLAIFGIGVILGAVVSRLLVGAGELLAIAGSMGGVAASASLASLALGLSLLVGALSAALLLRSCLGYRDFLTVRGQAPDFDERLRALCRLRGLNDTCAEVASCLLAGMGGPETCESLCIAPGTLNSAKREIYRSFGVHTASGLASAVAAQLKNGHQ